MTKLSLRNSTVGSKLVLMFVMVLNLTSTMAAQQRPEPGFRSALPSKTLLYVNDSPVSEAQFNAKRALVTEQQKTLVHQVEPSQDDLDAAALSLAVEEQILLNEAKTQGIEFSDAEIAQRVRSMQDEVNTSGTEDAKVAFHWAIEQHGLTDAEFATDPRVISAYRLAFTLGEIRSRIIASVAADGGDASATPQGRIARFVQGRAKLRAIDPSIARAAGLVRERLQLE